MNNPFSLVGKSILVTGASSGIGKQIALSTANAGGNMHVTGRNTERLKDTLNSLSGSDHESYIADLTKEAELNTLVNDLPPLDGLVLSAGVVKTLPFKFVTDDELSKIMQTNFTAPILLINKLLRLKKLKKGCSVVFITSISGPSIGIIGNSMYSASKAALNGIQKVLALELAPQKIRVNSIAPGMVKTELWQTDAVFTNEQIRDDEKKYPLGYGESADVANAAIYLLSDAGKWVTGISLVLDGGYTLQ